MMLWHQDGRRVGLAGAMAAAFLIVAPEDDAQARLVRITAQPPAVIDLAAFGQTGRYLKISGNFEGELDPADPRNAVIADVGLAPRTNGQVRYTSTFYMLRPADLGKGNRKGFYDFGNRGNKRILQWFNDGAESDDPTSAADFGNGFLMRQGYSVVWSGWAGDVAASPNMMSIELPISRNPDGTSIEGLAVAELQPAAADRTRMALPYPASTTSATNGVLTVRQHETDPKVPVADWSYVNARQIEFPGPAHVQWIYEFVYQAKDPKVMGIGHAATRDFLSFLKYADHDDFGDPNPLALGEGLPRFGNEDHPSNVAAVYSWGRSQGGRAQRDFLRLGFNQDESQRIVIDGMMPYATGSGGNMWVNFRFAQPTVSAQQHSRRHSHEPELPHTMAVLHDPLIGETDGVLRACLFSKTCPKILSIDSANEYWNKSGSLNHTDAFGQDLPIEDLAGDVRQYFIASIQHNTVFDAKAAPLRFCQQPENPLYPGPIFRAMSVALDQWVVFGVKPPASVVPQARNGTLVPSQAVRFPAIPATAYAGWPTLPPVQFNPDAVNVNVVADFSNVPPNRRGRATRLWSLKSTGTATTLPAYGSPSCRHPWAHLPAGRCSSRSMAERPPTFASSLVSSFHLPTERPSDWPPAIPASRSRSVIPQAAGIFGPCRRPRHHLCETAYCSWKITTEWSRRHWKKAPDSGRPHNESSRSRPDQHGSLCQQ